MKNKRMKGSMKGSLISSVIAVAVVVTSSVIVVNMISPVLEEAEMIQSYNEAKQVMDTINAVIKELMYEATGSMRTVELSAPEGNLLISGNEDMIKFRMKHVGTVEPGTRIKEGDIFITSGPNVNAYEGDVNSDGEDELVLENDAIIFAVRKYGSSSSPVFVNTSYLIPYIKEKRTGIVVTPISGLYINGLTNSSYGTGYTEISKPGQTLITNSIKLWLNSYANITYEAVFTLGAGNDFIELEIKNIQG